VLYHEGEHGRGWRGQYRQSELDGGRLSDHNRISQYILHNEIYLNTSGNASAHGKSGLATPGDVGREGRFRAGEPGRGGPLAEGLPGCEGECCDNVRARDVVLGLR
jgi:hypothetical protein